MEREKVSIIIPTFNRSNIILETLESIQNQTYSNWECVIIDDFSEDNTVDMVSSYILKDDRFKLLSNINKGACAARNLGLSHTNGRFVKFIDSDDLITNTLLEKQVNALESSDDLILAVSGWIKFNRKNDNNIYQPQSIDKEYCVPINWLIESWNGKGMSIPACWLIPRKLLKHSGNWNESLIKNQDGEFICRVISNSNKIKFVANTYALYRSPLAGNLSSTKTKESAYSQLNSYILYKYVLKHRDDDLIRKALVKNFSNLVYNEFNNNREIAIKAISEIQALNQNISIEFSNSFLNWTSKLIGPIVILKIRKYLKGF